MSPVRWCLLGLAVLALLVLASLMAGPSTWDEDLAWVRQQVAERDGRHAQCPVLVGEPRSGDPRKSYFAAAGRAGELPNELVERIHVAWEQVDAPPEPLAALLAELPAGIVDTMREGARCDAPFSVFDQLGDAVADWPVFGFRTVVQASVLEARCAATPVEAVDVWLDGLACGVDLAGCEATLLEMIGLYAMQISIDGCTDPWLRSLGATELRRIAAALRTTDAGMPERSDHVWGLATRALYLEANPDLFQDEIPLSRRAALWRHGFSAWNASAESVHVCRELLERFELRTPIDEAWPERRKRLVAMAALEPDVGPNPLGSHMNHCVDIEEGRRRTIGQLRLLRMALALRLGEQVPPLRDPLGQGTLRIEHGDGFVRLCGADAEVERRVEGL